MMRRILLWSFFLLSLAVGLGLRVYYAGECYDLEETAQGESHLVLYQVEADAYARLARVRRILDGHGLVQRFHPQENYPEGMQPTTTLPFDLLILAVYFPAKLFTADTLDWAGALVSPLLYLALAGFLFWWSRDWTLRARALLFFGLATFPSQIWATPFARPDHQSLNLTLIAIALCLEWNRWKPSRPASIAAGLCWGLAMWSSLYEPLILFIAVVLFNLISRRREQLPFLIATGATLAVAFLVEGFHLHRTPPELDAYLARWLSTVSEVKAMTLYSATLYFTPAVWLLPLLIFRYLKCGERKPVDWLLVLLTVALVVVAFLQTRWLYFTSFLLLLLMAGWYGREPVKWLRRIVLGVIIFSVMWSLDRDIDGIQNRETPPTAQLRRLARSINGPGGILAPWWLSPTLLYYSGQPIVAGSSHMTISGIVDTARFFTATTWPAGDAIVEKRHVRWIVVYTPERLLLNSRQILDYKMPLAADPSAPDNFTIPRQATLAEWLDSTKATPTRYRLRAVERDCKLYEYVPGN